MFKIAICDDDPIYIEFLKREILSFTSDHESEIYSYTSSEFFLKNLDENFDLVFMDYKIDSLNGIDLASKMREIGSKSILVFCTGEIAPTPVLFKLDTFRFLTKSSSDENIHSEIGAIIDYLREKNNVQYLEVLKNKSWFRIDISDINYITKTRGKSIIHLKNPSQEMEYEHLYDVLSEDLTIRCNNSIDEIYLFHEDTFEFAHSSYIVNLENIKSVFDDYIIMQDGVRLNISRSKNKIFHSKVNKFVKNKYKR